MKNSMLENTQGKPYLWITLTKNRQQRVIDMIFKHQRYLRLRIKDLPNWLTTSFAYTWNALSIPRQRLLNSDDLIGTLRAKNWSTVCRNNPFILNSLNFLTRKSESIKRNYSWILQILAIQRKTATYFVLSAKHGKSRTKDVQVETSRKWY